MTSRQWHWVAVLFHFVTLVMVTSALPNSNHPEFLQAVMGFSTYYGAMATKWLFADAKKARTPT